MLRLLPPALLLLLAACGGGQEASPPEEGAAPAPAPEPAAGETPGTGPGPVPDRAVWGRIEGIVRFEGEAPARREFNLSGQGACLKHHDGPVLTEDYLIQNGRVQNAIVWIRKGLHPDLEFPVPQEPVQFDQLGCVFVPHVLALRAGQPLQVNNGDDEGHNVNGHPRRNDNFNFTMPARQKNRLLVFKRPEVPVPITCDVHPWMSAYLGVFGHPYFAVTGPDGAYLLEDVPPGEYSLRVWHEKLGTQDARVVLAPSGTAIQDFRWSAGQ